MKHFLYTSFLLALLYFHKVAVLLFFTLYTSITVVMENPLCY
jgi:hypothetical protein